MRKLKLFAFAFGIFLITSMVVSGSQYALASPADQVQNGINQITDNKSTDKSLVSTVHSVLNILLYIIGALAVIMIIYGGLKYVTSRGESAEVTSAKNTIMYAVVGLVIAMLAYAIVGFVVGSLDASAKNPCSDPKNQPAPHQSGPTPVC